MDNSFFPKEKQLPQVRFEPRTPCILGTYSACMSMYVYVPLFATLSIAAQDLAMLSLQLGLTDEKSLVMVR